MKREELNNHPDLLFIEPKSQEKNDVKKDLKIGIKEVKQIHHQMSLYPYEAPYKVAIIDQAERMTPEAANSLLKTLEEPSGHSLLILISSRPKSLLPTIVSRCQVLRFLSVPREEINKGLNNIILKKDLSVSSDGLDKIIRLSMGRPGLALKYLEDKFAVDFYNKSIKEIQSLIDNNISERYSYAESLSKDVAEARIFLRNWLFWYRDILFFKLGVNDFIINPEAENYKDLYSVARVKNVIRNLIKTDSLLANPSVNAKLALEVLMLEI